MTSRVDLKVGFRCNNRCHFCVQGDKRRALAAKPLAQLTAALESGRRAGATGLVITGGEPTLHKDVAAAARLAAGLGYSIIQVQSNGRAFCYERYCRALVDAGANQFALSLHGSSARVHDFLTDAPGSFLQTVAGIGNLKRLGQQVLMNTVVTKPNCRDLPAIARLLAGLGADQVQFAYPHLSGRAAQNCGWLVARKSRVAPWIKRAIDAAVAAGIPAFTEAIPHCLMRGYERHVVERLIPDTMIFDATTVVADFTKARQNEDKAKGPRCGACARFKDCEGPWKEYPERFGWSEFVPIPRP